MPFHACYTAQTVLTVLQSPFGFEVLMQGRADHSPNADVKEVITQTRHPGEKALAGLSLAALAEADVALYPVSHSSSEMLWETPYETGYTQSSPSSAIPPPASGRKDSPLRLVQMALDGETTPLTRPMWLTITAQSSPHRSVHTQTSSGHAPPPSEDCRGFIRGHSSIRLNQGSMQEAGNTW